MEETVKQLFTEEEWKILPEYGAGNLSAIGNLPLTLENEEAEEENDDNQ